MPVPDESSGEVVFKIVYAGAEGAGKTTSLAGVHRLLGAACEPAITAQTSCDRTVVFGYRPKQPVMVRGLRARFQMMTVPGHVQYAATWQLALRGADGIVFVADSSPGQMNVNADALKATFLALQQNGTPLSAVPLVLQCNKRDMPGAYPTSEIDRVLNVVEPKAQIVESCAETGEGLLPALEALSGQMLQRFEHTGLGRENEPSSTLQAPPHQLAAADRKSVV